MLSEEEYLLFWWLLQEHFKPIKRPPLQQGALAANKSTSHSSLTGVTEDQHHHHAYGEIYAHDNAVPSESAVINTWYQVSVFDTNGPCHETVPDHTNDHITIGLTGDYQINCSLSLFDAQTQDWEFAVYTNNGGTYWDNIECQTTMLAGSKVLSTSFCGLASLTAGDTVELWYKCFTDGDQDLTIKLVNLNLLRML